MSERNPDSGQRPTLYDRLRAEGIEEQRDSLAETLENIRGDAYLWGIGELSIEDAMLSIRAELNSQPFYALPARRARG